ncbi:MAG: hypothetical protein NVS9B15_07330 [Acidobacteriaceae bacterium]
MPPTYTFEILSRAPLIHPPRTYVFPQRVEEIERGALHLMVQPKDGAPWLGIFALGYASPHVLTGVYPTPHPDRFVAVSGGYAYLCDSIAPDRTELLKQQPIVWTAQSQSPSLLLLADHRTITAITQTGIAWRSEPLSSEGLTHLTIEGDHLRGTGWDALSDTDTPFALDLHTGLLSG